MNPFQFGSERADLINRATLMSLTELAKAEFDEKYPPSFPAILNYDDAIKHAAMLAMENGYAQ